MLVKGGPYKNGGSQANTPRDSIRIAVVIDRGRVQPPQRHLSCSGASLGHPGCFPPVGAGVKGEMWVGSPNPHLMIAIEHGGETVVHTDFERLRKISTMPKPNLPHSAVVLRIPSTLEYLPRLRPRGSPGMTHCSDCGCSHACSCRQDSDSEPMSE